MAKNWNTVEPDTTTPGYAVADLPGHWQVNNLGHVRNLRGDRKWRLGSWQAVGYIAYGFKTTAEFPRNVVADLVARAFVPNKYAHLEKDGVRFMIKRRNGDVRDNSAANLYWRWRSVDEPIVTAERQRQMESAKLTPHPEYAKAEPAIDALLDYFKGKCPDNVLSAHIALDALRAILGPRPEIKEKITIEEYKAKFKAEPEPEPERKPSWAVPKAEHKPEPEPEPEQKAVDVDDLFS